MVVPVYIFIESECLAHWGGKRRGKVGIDGMVTLHFYVMSENIH